MGAEAIVKGFDHIGIAVVFFCHDGNGNFVMVKRSKRTRDEQGVWDIGGGALEFGDQVIDRLRQEIKEEYCTKVLKHEFLGYRDVHRLYKRKKYHWVTLDFKVLVDKGMVTSGEPAKFDDLKWFDRINIPNDINLHSQLPFFFKKYNSVLWRSTGR